MVISSEDKIDSEMLSVVTASPNTPRNAYAKAIMHVGNKNFYLNSLVSVYIKKDYLNNHSDYVEIEFQIPLGDFVYHVYPYRDNIDVSITYFSLSERTTIKYHMILDNYDENIKNNKYMTMKQEDLNKEQAIIDAQCVCKTYLKLKGSYEQGIFYNATVQEVLIVILSKRLKYVSDTPGNGIIIPPDNTRKYETIDIPNHTKTLDVVKYLQTGDFGIYNGDAHNYIQTDKGKDNLYIYPKYRYDLLSKVNKKLYIIGLSSLKLTGVNNTYALQNDIIKIVLPKAEKLFDDDTKLKSNGVADIAVNTDAVLSRPFKISKDKVEVKRDYLIERMQHKKLKSGITDVRPKKPTNNLYHARTDALKDDGVLVQFDWTFSNHTLLIPMMPVIYVYQDDDKIKTYEGLLYGIDSIIDNNKRIENSKITVYFKRPE